MHHAILGAGGVGGLLGTCLAHSGEQVTMVVRPAALRSYPERLHLESTFGNFDVAVERASTVPPADVLWIAVKATQLEDALRSIPVPAPARAMVPLLNGVDHVELLRERYGRDKVIPATFAGETERLAPGRFRHPSPFARLQVAEPGSPLLAGSFDELTRIGFICEFIGNEATLMWGKLVFLGPLALSTSAAAATVGEVLADPQKKQRFEDCVRETCAVGVAEGASVSPETVLKTLPMLPPNMRSSMQKDIEKGNPPELDAISGPILRGGAKHKIPVPATQALADAVARRAQHRP